MVNTSVKIHPSAIIDPAAVIGDGTSIGPFSVVGPHVVLGKENRVGSHVVIEGHTHIGDHNTFFQFASVGSAPQDLKFHGEDSRLVIGDKNIIREYATLQPGTEGGGMLTHVGSQNLFMASSHVGHDTRVGDRCVIANCAALAGHVTLGNGVIVGGLAGIHQFVHLGDTVMIGAGAMVAQDIPPFCIAQGDRACIVGINRVGLTRSGVPREQIHEIKKVFRELFLASGRARILIERIDEIRAATQLSSVTLSFLQFIENSERGVAPVRTAAENEDEPDVS